MKLISEIERYRPVNEQEACDKEIMLQYMKEHADCLERENQIAHFTVSAWTVNQERSKVLMAYHNIYDSWAWIGGHADGVEDLCAVAMRELQEETGVKSAVPVSNEIFSLEILTVNGHFKKGIYVPSHLHLNVTYLVEADETQELIVNKAENQAVKWWKMEEVLQVSKEPWMIEHIYKKLLDQMNSSVF